MYRNGPHLRSAQRRASSAHTAAAGPIRAAAWNGAPRPYMSTLPSPVPDDDLQPAGDIVEGALRLPVRTLPQPDEVTCGPTCLHAVYRYWGEAEVLTDVIARMHRLEHGGTFPVYLGCDALRRGYRAAVSSHSVTVFDPPSLQQTG